MALFSPSFAVFTASQFIDPLEDLLPPVRIEAVVSDHLEVRIGTVPEQFEQEKIDAFEYLYIGIISMIPVPVPDRLVIIIIFDDALF